MKKLLITEADRIAICEAADVLRRVFREEALDLQAVRLACEGLHNIQYFAPTWEDES